MKVIKIPIKLNKMPTVAALMFFSWLIALLGLIVGGYVIFLKFWNFMNLKNGFLILFGSLLLAILIRVLGNIGQILFDLKTCILGQNKLLNNDFTILKEKLDYTNLCLKNIKVFIESINGFVDKNSFSLTSLKTELKAELQEQNNNLRNLSDKLVNISINLTENTGCLIQDLREQIKILSNELDSLGAKLDKTSQNIEQINCDSKDLSLSLHEIKNFFAQIEKHLDLKK